MRALALLALAAGSTGCIDGCVRSYDPAAGGADLGGAPVQSAQWVRGSLTPLYRLIPRAEYGRLQHGGVTLRDRDFMSDVVTVSTAARLDELGKQLAKERGLGQPIDLMPEPADRERAQRIPFRGNPSDVKLVNAGGQVKAYVPLGGDVSAPGNQVAVVTSYGVIHLTVGVRPQRVAVHPAGLVFVCNQYSNYLSIIDTATDALLKDELETEYHCSDLVFVAKSANDADHQWLYVANRFRHSVLKYSADVVRDPASGAIAGISQALAAEISGVGHNPSRLALSPAGDRLYVANNKGGELAYIHLSSDAVGGKIDTGAPTADVVVVNDLVLVATTTPDRGLFAANEVHPPDVLAQPVDVAGLDGQSHRVHPGAQFDRTHGYGFEDVRNGIHQLDVDLAAEPIYYTDDVSAESSFAARQKVLAGALPQALARNQSGSYLYVALGGSDLVQELVIGGERPFALIPTRVFHTGKRPAALAVDEQNRQLIVVDWGGETLERFDLGTGAAVDTIGLGYSQPSYPATTIERGEAFFYSAAWSNNGRKSCASCHFDELDTDGLGFSNGTVAPTALHQVKPSHNLAATGAYYWNGSFVQADYASLEFAALTRTNCEVVELGLVEGPGSDPAARVGDPNNAYTTGQDADCRPVSSGAGLPANQGTIDPVIAAEKQVRDQRILAVTGLGTLALSRAIDFFAVSELRLPPNPLAQQYAAGRLDDAARAELDRGRALFDSAGCALCHDPARGYTDNATHGSGADWLKRFVDAYGNDLRVTSVLGALPQPMLDAIGNQRRDRELSVYVDAIDAFVPFCYELSNCLAFKDPLAAAQDQAEESRRLELLVRVNLADPDRGFVPGNVRGAPQLDTPSLRGVWTQPRLLHNGLARSVGEVILAPGHPGLLPGETGLAVDAKGAFDVHGSTSKLSAADARALVRYVDSIE